MKGSIEKRGENSYRLVVSGGTGPEHKRKKFKKTIHVKGKTEVAKMNIAETELAKFIAEVESNTYIEPSKMTFKDLADKWIKDYGETNLAPKTLYRYKEMLDSRIIPAIGHMKIEKIKPLHLVEFYKNLSENGIRMDSKCKPKDNSFELLKCTGLTMEEIMKKSDVSDKVIDNIRFRRNINKSSALKICEATKIKFNTLFDAISKPGGLSPQTIRHHHRLIHAIFETAVKEWHLLAFNPADIKPPKVPKKEAQFYEEEDIQALLFALDTLSIDKLKYKLAIYIDISTGLRLGELMGLKWGHIDMKTGVIKVIEATQYLPKMGTFEKEPKTETSKRELVLPGPILDMLKQYKIQQDKQKLKIGDKWQDTDFVFTQWNGLPMNTYTIGDWFPKFLKEQGLKKITFHQLRHTNATMLLKSGMDLKSVSYLLGHASVSTTGNIYAHVLQSANRTAAEKISDVLFKNNKKSDEKHA